MKTARFVRFPKPKLWWLLPPLLLLLGGLLAGRWIVRGLPPVAQIDQQLTRPTTRILDRNGRLLYELLDPNAGKQLDLPLADPASSSRFGIAHVPDACVYATLATEDSRFFLHPGVDPIAIARAAYQNWRAGGEIVSGGSTLTQQLARNLLLSPEERYQRSLRRKLREAWLALQMERRYSKTELLQLYLNQTYYGRFAFGLEAAAQNFFAKPAAQLSPAECALLAGLVQYPSGYDPLIDPDVAKARQEVVLRLMAEAGFIDAQQRQQIAAQPLQYESRLFDIAAPHFVVYVQDQLLRRVGVDRLRAGGLTVYTTLDLGLQQRAEAAVRRRLAQLNCALERQGSGVNVRAVSPAACQGQTAQRQVENAAAVVLDVASGEILALVGSPDYFDRTVQGNVNGALALRQPGSAIKPLTYAAALDPAWSSRAGVPPLTPASILADIPTAFPGGRGNAQASADPSGEEFGAYMPENYDLRYHGPVSVRAALANSYNIPAVKVLQRMGVPTLQALAGLAGISSFTGEYGLALTLGGGEVRLLELTAAYGIFPRGGQRLQPRAILRIEGREGAGCCALSPETADPAAVQVIAPETAYLISDILSDPVARIPAFGENSVLDLPFPAAAKTGTTTDWRDNWTVGFSSQRLVGVWVGNADNRPMQGITGIDGAGPIWQDLMRAAHPAPAPGFARPPRLREISICAPSGLLPSGNCPLIRQEKFIPGTEPTRPDDQFVTVAIDRRTGARATAETPDGQIVQRTFWRLPPEFGEWAAANGIPQPPPASGSANTPASNPPPVSDAQPQASADPPAPALVLAAPIHNSAYKVHPGLPAASQRLRVHGYSGDGERWAELRLLVNGAVIAQATDARQVGVWWQLAPGSHTFQIEGKKDANAKAAYSQRAKIVVE